MKKLITIVLTVAMIATAGTALASVLNTPHDYRGIGNLGLCNNCHVPHAAPNAQRLWVVALPGGHTWDNGGNTTWEYSNIGILCGKCHHSAIDVLTSNNNDSESPHTTDDTAYAANSHGREMNELEGTTLGEIRDTAANVAGRPYMDKTYMECSSCHDPHDNSVMPFLRNDGTAAMDTISEVCTDCHDRTWTALGVANTMTRGANDGASIASMHPYNTPYADAAGNEGDDGTVLRTLAAGSTLRGAISATAWDLGAKFVNDNAGAEAGAGNIGCETCHTVHGDADGAGNNGVAPDNIYLLAINNNGDLPNAPLCETCHGGGAEGRSGGNTIIADGDGGTAGTNYWVGGYYTLPSGAMSVDGFGQPRDDHPIDIKPDGTPALVRWADNLNYRWERTAWGARSAGDPGQVGALDQWVMGNYSSSPYIEGTTTMGSIVCVSCHSAHNGISNTSLRRKGGIVAGTTNPADMSAPTGDTVRAAWCYNCHAEADTVPSYHHSTTTDGVTAANYTNGDMLGGNSAVECGDCHNAGTVPQAHNGFFNLAVANAGSELCINCHNGVGNDNGDPLRDSVLTINPGNAHTLNGVTGGGSHWIGTFADGSTSGVGWDINVKRGFWRNVNGQNVYSKYGGGSNVDTHHRAAPEAHSGTQKIVCESCHSVLYNAGWDGAGTWSATQGGAAVWSAEGGWKTNLLLQLYEDRARGTGPLAQTPVGYNVGESTDVDGIPTGSGLCIQCHNQGGVGNWGAGNGLVLGSIASARSGLGALTESIVPRNMHPMTGWTITRAVDSWRGNASGAENALWYLQTDPAGETYADAALYAPDPSYGGTNSFNSYEAEDKMDCDSCHTPHNAMVNGNILGDPKTGTGPGVPSIVHEINIPAVGGAGQNHDDVCVACHDR